MIGPLPYIGGKNRLAHKIIALFPPHVTFVEVFSGGAQVFFKKPPSKVEVLNDLDRDIVNFFRVCQNHYEELVRYLRFTLASRAWWDLLATTPPESLTDIQRAGRFFYLQKNCFGGKVTRANFHYVVVQNSNFNPKRIPEILEQAHQRLARVQLECLPYEKVLEKYDRPTTLFYLDPPYWQRTLYRFNFSEADFLALEQRLSKLKGRFILSIDDRAETRQLFSPYRLLSVRQAYSAQKCKGRTFGELLVTNFEPPHAAKQTAPVN